MSKGIEMLALELLFLCSAFPFNALYQCTKFYSSPLAVFELCSEQALKVQIHKGGNNSVLGLKV